jgi:hypothetical protein
MTRSLHKNYAASDATVSRFVHVRGSKLGVVARRKAWVAPKPKGK